jgi:hypothetical protein
MTKKIKRKAKRLFLKILIADKNRLRQLNNIKRDNVYYYDSFNDWTFLN